MPVAPSSALDHPRSVRHTPTRGLPPYSTAHSPVATVRTGTQEPAEFRDSGHEDASDGERHAGDGTPERLPGREPDDDQYEQDQLWIETDADRWPQKHTASPISTGYSINNQVVGLVAKSSGSTFALMFGH